MIRAAKFHELDRTELEAAQYEAMRRGCYATLRAISREKRRRFYNTVLGEPYNSAAPELSARPLPTPKPEAVEMKRLLLIVACIFLGQATVLAAGQVVKPAAGFVLCK